jgi:hypothetical protein
VPGFSEEFDRALKDGFTDAEVKAAKEGVMQERILGRTEDGRIAGALATQAFLGPHVRPDLGRRGGGDREASPRRTSTRCCANT